MSAVRAHGRSLADFEPLLPAERLLMEQCGRGRMAIIADERPAAATPDNELRAGFVRFLALGGDDAAPVHEHGIKLRGAWITGPLMLESGKIASTVALLRCRIEHIRATNAHCITLSLRGSKVENGITADRLRCDGSLFLSEGFESDKEVRMLNATIGGSFNCRNGRFSAAEGAALSCDGVSVSGGVSLNDGFHATGEVRLLGATINGDLTCGGAKLERPGGDCLSADRMTVKGSVFLNRGFAATGTVRLVGVSIGSMLDCAGSTFDGTGATSALSLEGATIGRHLFLRDNTTVTGQLKLSSIGVGRTLDLSRSSFRHPGGVAIQMQNARVGGAFVLNRNVAVEGRVDLTSAHVASLCDDATVWEGAAGQLTLDHFTYDRLLGSAPTDADRRIAWLRLQRPGDLADRFRPQPWEQVIAVLRAMGLPQDARKVAIAKQEALRRAGRIARGDRWLHRLYGALVGYGYRPQRLARAILGVWLVWSLFYWAAVHPAWFGSDRPALAPAQNRVPIGCIVDRAIRRDPRPCAPPVADYADFVPLIYSADALLPVVNLGYKSEWKPVLRDAHGPLLAGQVLRFLFWFEVAFGWLAGLLLVSVLGGLVKKD